MQDQRSENNNNMESIEEIRRQANVQLIMMERARCLSIARQRQEHYEAIAHKSLSPRLKTCWLTGALACAEIAAEIEGDTADIPPDLEALRDIIGVGHSSVRLVPPKRAGWACWR